MTAPRATRDSTWPAPDHGIEPLDWMSDALCWQVAHYSAFYPVKGGSNDIAKKVCDMCPVRALCLDFAMTVEEAEHSYRHGIWGGLNTRERNTLWTGGWRPGDPAPDVNFVNSPGRCPLCGKQARDLGRHQSVAHAQAGAA